MAERAPGAGVFLDLENLFKGPLAGSLDSSYEAAAATILAEKPSGRTDDLRGAVIDDRRLAANPGVAVSLAQWLEVGYAPVVTRGYGKRDDDGVRSTWETLAFELGWTTVFVGDGSDVADRALVKDVARLGSSGAVTLFLLGTSDVRLIKTVVHELALDTPHGESEHRLVLVLGPTDVSRRRFGFNAKLGHIEHVFRLSEIHNSVLREEKVRPLPMGSALRRLVRTHALERPRDAEVLVELALRAAAPNEPTAALEREIDLALGRIRDQRALNAFGHALERSFRAAAEEFGPHVLEARNAFEHLWASRYYQRLAALPWDARVTGGPAGPPV